MLSDRSVCHHVPGEYLNILSPLSGKNELLHFSDFLCCVAPSAHTPIGLPYLQV
jgi:hypothetical protein